MAGDGGDRGSMLAALAPARGDRGGDPIEEGLDLVVANRNAPKQSVLSGPTAEIARAAEAFARRGISTRPLEVSAAFHSRFVEDATGPAPGGPGRGRVRPGRRRRSSPTRPPSPIPTTPTEARSLLAHQLARPVRFVEQVEAMARSGIRTFLEVGPDARLTGLVGAILEGQGALGPGAGRLARQAGQRRRPGPGPGSARRDRPPGPPDPWDEGAEPRPVPPGKPGLTVKVSGANFAPKPPPARPAVPATPDPGTPAQDEARTRPTRAPAPPDPGPRRRASTRPERLDPPRRPKASRARRRAPRPPAAPGPRASASSVLAEALRASQENLVAFQRLGEQTANLHRQYLEGQDRATMAFHSLIEHHQRLTLAAIGMAPPPLGPGAVAAPPARRSPGPRSPARLRIAPAPVARPIRRPRAERDPAASAGGRGPEPVVDRPRSRPRPRRRARPFAGSAVHAVLVEVVSEKTGYPAEVLEPGMQLDADLGIDSIKRVEILAALQERLPEAPVIGPEHLGTIRTLGQIAEFLGGEPAGAVDLGAGRRGRVRPPRPASDGACGPGGGGLGEDGLSGRGPGAGDAAGRRPGDRLDQAGGDPGGVAGAAARGAGDRPGAPGDHPHPRPDRRIPRRRPTPAPGRPDAGPLAGPPPRPRPSPPSPVRRLIPTVVPLEGPDRRESIVPRPGGEVWVLDDGSDLAASIVDRLGAIGPPGPGDRAVGDRRARGRPSGWRGSS